MSKYNLQSNESFILENDHVRHGNSNGELILTNLNLVYITTKGVFRTNYIHQIYPIKQIKVFNEKAQVVLGKDGNIDIYFVNGMESFKFWNTDSLFSMKKAEKEASRWINAINNLITGQVSEIDMAVTSKSVDSGVIAGAIKDTFEVFKGALGGKTQNNNEIAKKVAKKCSFCGAPISGVEGQIVRCQYCDGDQQL
ncbi:hypothetical protein H9660_06245 [Clostridium sp. Sa3CUN1]|uniref:PH domain-containing protein n=1 Tax=Clostridium gallinarum TaxID=2762246 RepID=A0ABR8Q2U7_9CLOT|nr:hypothetical protein [Clostridium gallinarum]MBD7914741.1 hypothetical protein [Clostridium gallinarum]